MKRLKFLSYAFILIAVFTLSSCAEDAILEEIIDNTELGAPSLETDDDPDEDDEPTASAG